jgi:NADH-quinone oxidoreductase subunit L
MTFHGKSRMSKHVEEHVHESPKSILFPLIALSILSIVGGFIGLPTYNAINSFLAPVIGSGHHGMAHSGEAHHASLNLMFTMMGVSTGIAVLGIIMAFVMYILKPDYPRAIAKNFKYIYNIIFNKYYVDEIYDATIVKPTVKGSFFLWKVVDVRIIDGFVNAVARLTILNGEVLRLFQTGFVRNYALSILLGGIIILVCSILFL